VKPEHISTCVGYLQQVFPEQKRESNTFILFISVNISVYVNLDELKIILEVLEHSDNSDW
jgi:hypothetical protein